MNQGKEVLKQSNFTNNTLKLILQYFSRLYETELVFEIEIFE